MCRRIAPPAKFRPPHPQSAWSRRPSVISMGAPLGPVRTNIVTNAGTYFDNGGVRKNHLNLARRPSPISPSYDISANAPSSCQYANRWIDAIRPTRPIGDGSNSPLPKLNMSRRQLRVPVGPRPYGPPHCASRTHWNPSGLVASAAWPQLNRVRRPDLRYQHSRPNKFHKRLTLEAIALWGSLHAPYRVGPQSSEHGFSKECIQMAKKNGASYPRDR